MIGRWCIILNIVLVSALAACGPPKQAIPISTNPIGATIYADGKKVGTTPLSVRFDKQRDHLITVVKEGYHQVDLTIMRRFKPDKALRDGALSGLLRGGDPEAIAGEMTKEVDEQERSGEAYELVPPVITITLRPLR